jgi:hypothetical protein
MARLPRGKWLRGVVLLVTVIVVVLASTVGPGVLVEDREPASPDYDLDEQLPEEAPADGELAVEQRAASGVILVDIAHRNRMSQSEIKPLLAAITSAGYEIDLLESDDDFDRSLSRADAFIVIDPSVGYTDDEVNRVETFVDRGGRLLLIGEPTTLDFAGFGLRIRVNRLTPLSSRFGFEFGEAHLFNMAENDGNHENVFAEPVGDHRLTNGVSRTAFYAATQINVRDGQPLLQAIDGTRSARTDDPGTYSVAAVNGNVLALADGTFLRRGNFNIEDNNKLVSNVAGFLVSGDKRRTLYAYPTFVSADPSIRYTSPALVDAAQKLAGDLRQESSEPTLQLQRRAVSPNRTDILVTTFGYLERRGQLQTGISVSDGQVQVRGYNSATRGIIVIRAPARNYDLVIAADTQRRAERAVELLADGDLRDHLINRRTAVVRTSSAAGS